MHRSVIIQWTETAKEALKKLPRKAQVGILAKADELAACDNPQDAHKPLTGPLQGYCRLTDGRFRAIYTVEEEQLESEDEIVHVTIRFVLEGIRKEHDKKDVYRLA